VLNYWPRPNVTVPQVKSTYNKMLSSEMNGKQASIQHTNGQVNAAA
jgi:chromodomain-helicase-DNA-binding protein 1